MEISIKKIKRLLVANRSEIAIRVCRAAHELGIHTVAIYSHEDRFALHRFKAEESYQIGKSGEPVKAYLDIEGIVQLAKDKDIDAIHPGYGFLSENTKFARACEDAGIIFVGPRPDVLKLLGDKTSARKIAAAAQVPILSGSDFPLIAWMRRGKFAPNWGTRLLSRLPMAAADAVCVWCAANWNWDTAWLKRSVSP